MAKNIKGNNDGLSGSNETYRIPGRGGAISRSVLVMEVKQGKHEHFHTVVINGKEYVRSNPDGQKKNNVNT